jgi:hypothetical protein
MTKTRHKINSLCAVSARCSIIIFILAVSLAFTACPDNDDTPSSTSNTVATPTANPPQATQVGTQSVWLETATDGAEIWYTLNGPTPEKGGSISLQYTTGPIVISTSTTIRARAFKDGYNDSGMLVALFTILPDTEPPPVHTANNYTLVPNPANNNIHQNTTSGAVVELRGITWYAIGKALILDNVTFETSNANILELPYGSRIILAGNSTLRSTATAGASTAIRTDGNGYLIIEGRGSESLKIESGGATSSTGIYVTNGNLTISAADITIETRNANTSTGINANGNMIVENSSKVNVTTGNATSGASTGIVATGTMTVTGSTVTAQTGTATTNSTGINAGGTTMTVTNSTVTAQAGGAPTSRGINMTSGSLTVQNLSTVTALAGAGASSIGIGATLFSGFTGPNNGTITASGHTSALSFLYTLPENIRYWRYLTPDDININTDSGTICVTDTEITAAYKLVRFRWVP